MNNSLIPKDEISFWERIKNFWKIKILRKLNKNDNTTQNNISEEESISKDKTTFSNELKVNIEGSINKEYKLKQFMKEIEDNPNLIDNLSNERLDKLIEYYEKITEEKQNKIQKLKLSTN